MRQLDNYEQFFDNDKNFLVGSLVFCKKGTSTQETIYSWDSENEQYVPINPVQFISIDGRPNTQIFLSDVDYTIYVNKYIGNGDMQTDIDPNNWAFQYSFNNLYDVISLKWTNDVGLGLFVFENLQQMKSTIEVEMYSDSMVVALAGWSAKGDKPITHYYWDENCNETATDVEFVKPNWVGAGAGRWVLINEFESGFDVRNAGCFPTETSAGDVEQTYALQRAEAYCIKYGLKIVIPHTLGSLASCYKISNLILNSPLYVQDGATLYTSDSATLNNITEDNRGRNIPFICRDLTNKGTWQVVGETIETAYFQNNDANETAGWRPTILPKSKLVYNKKFDTNYDGTLTAFHFERIAVDITAKPHEKIYFEYCDINENATIAYPCQFEGCAISQNLFDATIDYNTFSQMEFVNCFSDFGNWLDPNLFVMYKAINKDPTIDLQGQWCSIDLTDYGIDYCFQNVNNAIFDVFRMPKISGTFAQILFMHNVKVVDFLIEQYNTELTTWTMDDCDVTIDDTSHALVNCQVKFMNTTFEPSSGAVSVQSGAIRECFFGCRLVMLNYATICDCVFFENPMVKATSDNAEFKIVFDGNVLGDGIQLQIDLNGRTLCHLSACSFCNNSLQGTRREMIDVIPNGGTWSTLNTSFDYVYDGNVNVMRGNKFKQLVAIPYYKSGDTIPAGVDVYFQQVSGGFAKLYGHKIQDFIFSFGEDCKRDVLAQFVCNNSSLTTWELGVIDSNGITHVYQESESVMSIPVVYKKGTSQNTLIFNNADNYLCVFISDSANTDDTIYGILSVEYLD